jgi:plasmid stabilization system protein ParE
VDFQIRITEEALVDLEDLLRYSWEHFPETTETFGQGILSHIELLKDFPYVGRPVKGRTGVRELAHAPFVILYRVDSEKHAIEILKIRHNSRGHV